MLSGLLKAIVLPILLRDIHLPRHPEGTVLLLHQTVQLHPTVQLPPLRLKGMLFPRVPGHLRGTLLPHHPKATVLHQRPEGTILPRGHRLLAGTDLPQAPSAVMATATLGRHPTILLASMGIPQLRSSTDRGRRVHSNSLATLTQVTLPSSLRYLRDLGLAKLLTGLNPPKARVAMPFKASMAFEALTVLTAFKALVA